jgi:hypothetical protein
MYGCCEHGNEHSGFMKFCDFLEWQTNWQLLEKGMAPWNDFVVRVVSKNK